MVLKLKPVKCISLSISSGVPNDIEFAMNDHKIATLRTSHHKFLGSVLTYTGKQSDIFKVVFDHFENALKTLINSL